ncbi:MAG: DEAD/DEAH box helicase [Deltaproteobacteria bacterium]|nr:DEAD/DEAH box helicase [Deltaproteobacteria bacterium]
MVVSAASHNQKLFLFLRRFAPPSIVEKGISLAQLGCVTETSKSGSIVSGCVRDQEELVYNPSLEFISQKDVLAACSCCSREEMHEQWCSHAVALLWRATDLGFFESNSGFAAQESTFRFNISSPQEVANVLAELGRQENEAPALSLITPEVSIYLDLNSDRLGVRLLFDGESQGPALFESISQASSRALDNLLLQLLDEHGSWDDIQQLWYVNSSSGIEKILGLIQEYEHAYLQSSGGKIRFDHRPIGARVILNWSSSGLELSMEWLLPDGKALPKEQELLGTGPYWTCIDSTVYRLSPVASRIAALFGYAPRITFSRAQSGPVLEALQSITSDVGTVIVKNPALQPETQVCAPLPVLDLQLRDTAPEHFDSSQTIYLNAKLEFDYPSPPAKRNLVYLPDRGMEREYVGELHKLGFQTTAERNVYQVSGDAALDLIEAGEKAFSRNWTVNGLDTLRSSIRFSDLSINLSVGRGANADKKSKSAGALDWFDCHVSLIRNNANIPISTLFKSARGDNDRWICLDNGSYARVPGGGLSYLKTTLGVIDPNFRLSNTIKARLNVAQTVSLSRIEESGFNLTIGSDVEALADKFKNFKSIKSVKAPKSFHGKLRHYQEDGVSWLNFLMEFELGGILADEMGLGKTVQALAFLQFLKGSAKGSKGKPALIIAPTSVITNWCYEAKRFTPELKVLLLHGPERKSQFQSIPEYDVVITSYALLRIDRYDLEKYEFLYCILDEAQNIKNAQAATTKAAKAIRARHRLAMTGTPTENRPMELWSIMDFLMPGYLGSLEFFRQYIEKPILEGGPGVQVARFLNAKTRPFILRRTKAEVERDLPPKIESVLHVEMTPSQRQLYGQILAEVRPKVFEAVSKKGIRGASVSILAALLRLRQVCNHPNSIESLRELPGFDSGKFNLLQELLEEALDSGRKILLFSQFKDMLALIRQWLASKQVEYLYLDGGTKERQPLIDRFNGDESIRLFLISLKAGGTGLNLASADTVIIYDPWWNPAVESQAVDRAHRIGQKRTVNVYRLVTENSVEQKIMELKSKKSKIVDALINENGLSTAKLTQSDLESLFSAFPESGGL